MPKIGSGIPYFDIQTDIAQDKRIKLLKAEFGIKGFGIWIELIRQIYADEGYFLKWDNDTKLLFASDVGESGGLVDEVVQGSVKRGLFDESVFDQFDVLTSKHIQEKYISHSNYVGKDFFEQKTCLVERQDCPKYKFCENKRLSTTNPSKWQSLRIKVFERDNHTCTYCGEMDDNLELDHITPFIDGGKPIEDNLTTACRTCNRSKGDKSIEEFLFELND